MGESVTLLVCILHQTTTRLVFTKNRRGCLSTVSYIKPQLHAHLPCLWEVVYRLYPTSNHNVAVINFCMGEVVYRLYPTSNHNTMAAP